MAEPASRLHDLNEERPAGGYVRLAGGIGISGNWGGTGSDDIGYEALLSGSSFNNSPGTGVFVSYSFLDAVPAGYSTTLPEGLETFQPLTEAQKDLARAAIAAWSKVSGITFFEVDPQDGDIRFGVYDLSTVTPDIDETGFAYLPDAGGEGLLSDVFVDKLDADSLHLYLHEIGHALGLKHPFEDSPVLPARLDNFHNTVMSYNPGGESGEVLGELDIEAIRHLYGESGDKGDQIPDWSWDANTLTLTQRGDKHSETIFGIGGTDRIWAGKGNDVVYAKEGNDAIYGEDGNDSIAAGAGNDTVSGGAGDDSLVGGAGDDILNGDAGHDTLAGGAGSDYYYVGDGDVATDVLNDGGYDTVESTAAAHTLGTGIERLLLVGPAQFGTGNGLANSIVGNDLDNRLAGMVGNDTLIGAAGADTLVGGNGDDRLDGGSGDDTVSGGAGDDTLIAGTGNDLLDGGTGIDTMKGGAGDDVYIVDNRKDAAVESPAAGHDLVKASATYSLRGNIEDLTLTGRTAIDGTGNSLANLVTGNGAANLLRGLDGNDTLVGGGGDDTLTGGAGTDLLQGGAGRDVFRFGTGHSAATLTMADRIVDFAAGDRIDLSPIDAVTGVRNNAFSFIGEAAFSAKAGQLRAYHLDGDTIVAGDVNGDGKADFTIVLSGVHDLVKTDFIL